MLLTSLSETAPWWRRYFSLSALGDGPWGLCCGFETGTAILGQGRWQNGSQVCQWLIVTGGDSGADSTSYGCLVSVSGSSKMPKDTTPRFVLRSFPLDGETPGRPPNHMLSLCTCCVVRLEKSSSPCHLGDPPFQKHSNLTSSIKFSCTPPRPGAPHLAVSGEGHISWVCQPTFTSLYCKFGLTCLSFVTWEGFVFVFDFFLHA